MIFLISLLSYWPIFSHSLLSDDWPLFKPAGGVEGVLASFHGHWFGGGPGSFYRPLARVHFYFLGRLFGTNALGGYLVGFGLFSATIALISERLKTLASPAAGWLFAAFTFLNPQNTETVSWIASQTDLLCLFWMSVSLWAILRPLEDIRIKHVVISLVFAVLSYGTKESSVLLLPLLVIWLLVQLAYGRWKHLRRSMVPWVLLASHLLLWIGYFVLRRVFLGQFLVPDDINYDPPYGWLWHRGTIIHAILFDYFRDYLPWFEFSNIRSHGGHVYGIYAAYFLILVVLAKQRSWAAIGLLLAFPLGFAFVVGADVSWFYDTFNTERRLFYTGNLLLAAAFAQMLGSGVLKKSSQTLVSTPKWLLLVGLLLMWQSSVAISAHVTDWTRNSRLVMKFREEVDAYAQSGREVSIFEARKAPDIGQGMSMRNGNNSLCDMLWDNVEYRGKKKFEQDKMTRETIYLILHFSGEKERMVYTLQEAADGKIPK